MKSGFGIGNGIAAMAGENRGMLSHQKRLVSWPLGTLGALGALMAGVMVGHVEAKEKIFVSTIEGPPESLDPAKGTSLESINVTWHLCDALLDISKDGRTLEPRLAESWTLSEDGRRVVFTLRSGVQFHDGTPLDATAVKSSIEREFQPSHKLYMAAPENAHEALLSALIEDVEVRGDHTLLIALKYPGLHYLSQVAIVSPAALAELGTEFGRRPVCSGPFEFASWTNNEITLAANKDYWQGRPVIDQLVFRLMSEGEAVTEALLKGEVDLVPDVPDPVVFERLQEDPRIKLERIFGLNVGYLGFYMERPPFDDRTLRRAVVAAFNVPRAIVFLGRGSMVPAQSPLSPTMKFYDSAVAQASYDPETAGKLLRESGTASGLKVDLIHNNSDNFFAELAGAIQSDLRRVGIHVELVGKPSWKDMLDAVRQRQGDMFFYGWNLRAPYPERLLIPLFHSRSAGTTNLTYYQNPLVDQLLDDVLYNADDAEQQKIYSQIQALIVDDAPMLFLYHRVRIAAYSERVKGLEFNLGGHPYDKLVAVDITP